MKHIAVLCICLFTIAACDQSSKKQATPIQVTETQTTEVQTLPVEQSPVIDLEASGQNSVTEEVTTSGQISVTEEVVTSGQNSDFDALIPSCGGPLLPFVIEGLNIVAHDDSALTRLSINWATPSSLAEEGVAWDNLRLFIYGDIFQPVSQAKRWRFSLFNSAFACSPAPYSETDMLDVSVISDAALGAEYPAVQSWRLF